MPGAHCDNIKGWRPCPKLMLRGKVWAWAVCTYNVLHVVICVNTVVNTLPSRHVQRALYFQPYYRLSFWSPVLLHPLCGEPNGTCFIVHRLIVAAAHYGLGARHAEPECSTCRHYKWRQCLEGVVYTTIFIWHHGCIQATAIVVSSLGENHPKRVSGTRLQWLQAARRAIQQGIVPTKGILGTIAHWNNDE